MDIKIKTDALKEVRSWLREYKSHIEIIKDLRHQQIAHHDFEQNEAISLNFDNLEILNDLYDLAKKNYLPLRRINTRTF